MKDSDRPLVYSCSGCSSVAQLANQCAVRLDRENLAEMSCISGVGGGVPALTRLARSGRPILALDGCALACVKACLAQAGVAPDTHLVLNQLGARKRYHADCGDDEAATVWLTVREAVQELSDEPLLRDD
ncbi:putative zinc-binding protein [Chitinivorax sp. PXF-14]|uniref:putative zinc-binding protein n=1 Tax=Chitinivorax sp. PXF-14 TaxID=3230488 RepID=UPI003464F7C8